MVVRILLVDDHAIILDGIEALFRNSERYKVVDKATRGELALSYLKREPIDFMITDFSMGDMNGLELIKKARELNPELKVLVLSMHDEMHVVKEVMKAGANGYLLKNHTHDALAQAVDTIWEGGVFYCKEIEKQMAKSNSESDSHVAFTERELEVLKLIAKGFTTKEIASVLYISERTVETHRKNLMRKSSCHNAPALVQFATSRMFI